MKLDYNDIKIRTVRLSDMWDSNLRTAFMSCMFTRKAKLYVGEFRGAPIGFCYAEYARLLDMYILLPCVGSNFKAKLINATRYVLFDKTDCSAIEFILDGTERDKVLQSLEGAQILDAQEEFYRVQVLRKNNRVVV